jgi:leucyl-tRNA synthetase
MQAQWEASKPFEADAPAEFPVNSATGAAGEPAKNKFMVTFPYPYMNGRLHLGHAFTVTKAEFAAGYQALKGKNVLFPFGFHCTGMPIQAAANKLRRELETGAHLKKAEEPVASPEPVAEESPAAPGGEAVPTPAAGGAGAKPADGKFVGKKTKAVAKTGGPGMTQYAIMLKSGLKEEDIPKFADPNHWLGYFPPLGKVSFHNDVSCVSFLCFDRGLSE